MSIAVIPTGTGVMFFTEQPEVEIISRLLAIQSSAMIDPDGEISTREIDVVYARQR